MAQEKEPKATPILSLEVERKARLTNTNEVRVFHVSDLPAEEQQRYAAMGVNIERRLITTEPNIKGLTISQFKALRAEMVRESTIRARFGITAEELNEFKVQNGMGSAHISQRAGRPKKAGATK